MKLRMIPLLLAAFFGIAPAAAETRTFVVDAADGYGVNECLATGQRCGSAAADAWCRSQDYVNAIRYGRRGLEDVTASVGARNRTCSGRHCDRVTITCTR